LILDSIKKYDLRSFQIERNKMRLFRDILTKTNKK